MCMRGCVRNRPPGSWPADSAAWSRRSSRRASCGCSVRRRRHIRRRAIDTPSPRLRRPSHLARRSRGGVRLHPACWAQVMSNAAFVPIGTGRFSFHRPIARTLTSSPRTTCHEQPQHPAGRPHGRHRRRWHVDHEMRRPGRVRSLPPVRHQGPQESVDDAIAREQQARQAGRRHRQVGPGPPVLRAQRSIFVTFTGDETLPVKGPAPSTPASVCKGGVQARTMDEFLNHAVEVWKTRPCASTNSPLR